MPIRKAQGTGWIHEDHKVQREFERVHKLLSDLSQETAGIKSKSSNSGQTGGQVIPENTTDSFVNNTYNQSTDLSILHNDNYVSEKIVKEIDFDDADNYPSGTATVPIKIKFELTEDILTIGKRSKVHVRAEGTTRLQDFVGALMIEREFSYRNLQGKDLLIGTIPANCRIDSVYVRIQEVMDLGELNVYTLPDNLIIMRDGVVITHLLNHYHRNYTIKTLNISEIFLTFVGQNPTQGSGLITIFYHGVQ